jgi:ABC-type multidrug transport system fused ATPase/permease subunit
MIIIKILFVLLRILNKFEKIKLFLLLIGVLFGMFLEICTIILLVPIFNLNGLNGSNNSMFKFISQLGYSISPDKSLQILFFTIVLFFFYVFKNTFSAFLIHKQYDFSFSIQEKITKKLFISYLNKDFNFFTNTNSSLLVQNVNSEISGFSSYIMIPFLTVITEMFVIIGYFFVLFSQSKLGFSIIFIVMSLFIYLFFLYYKAKYTKWGLDRFQFDVNRQKATTETFNGIKEVKLFNSESFFFDKFSFSNSKSIYYSTLQTTSAQIPKLWIEVIGILSLPLFVFILYKQGNSFNVVITSLMIYAASSIRMLPSFNRILGTLGLFKFGQNVLNLIDTIPNTTFDYLTRNREKNYFELKTSIKFENVYFSYDGIHNNLKNINVFIAANKTTGIIGRSGSGKSTFSDLILGFYTPNEGSITIDSTPLNDMIINWRKNVGYVSQNIFLTDDSLISNIAFGVEPSLIDFDRVNDAIMLSCLSDFVLSLPNGVYSNVGERGVKLSGGQRQRIGLARALYINPSVLILDEATSALDIKTEEAIMNDIYKLNNSKTIIIISHRLSTLKKCDTIIEFSNGEIINNSSPDFFDL